MIARPLPPPSLPVPTGGGRSGRMAVIGRRKAGIRRRYSALIGVGAWISLATTVVIVYLFLLANVARVSYELTRASHERGELQDETLRLDDQIARLTSRERLTEIAGRMGMRDPSVYAVVRIPKPRPVTDAEHGGLAFLSAITAWIR